MVDTGATLTVLPPRIAEEIGIPRLPMTLRLELADGRHVAAEAGPVILSCRGIQVPATVVIVPRARPLLGTQALKSLGLTVSARTGKLRRVRKARNQPSRKQSGG
jgi:predicted aspartyl protease